MRIGPEHPWALRLLPRCVVPDCSQNASDVDPDMLAERSA